MRNKEELVGKYPGLGAVGFMITLTSIVFLIEIYSTRWRAVGCIGLFISIISTAEVIKDIEYNEYKVIEIIDGYIHNPRRVICEEIDTKERYSEYNDTNIVGDIILIK